MAFLTDKRGQFERFQSDGSIHVDSENPNRNTLTNEQRPPLVEKPFDFKYNQINSRTTDLGRFLKFLKTPGGIKMQGNLAILQQTNRDFKETFSRNAKPTGTLLGNALRAAKEVVIDTIKTNVGFTQTLAKQIPVNGTGTHFVNNLNGPTYLKQGGDPKSALGKFLKNTIGLPEVAFGFRLAGSGNIGLYPENDGTVQSNFVEKNGDDFLPTLNSQFDRRKLIDPTDPSPFGRFINNDLGNTDFLDLAKKKGEEQALLNSGFTAPKTSDPFLLDTSKPLAKALVQSRLSRLKGNQTGLPGKDITRTENLKNLEAVYLVSQSVAGSVSEYTVAKNAISVKLFEEGKDFIGQYTSSESPIIDETLENQEFFTAAFNKQLIPFSISNITPEKSYNLFFHAFLDDYTDTYSGNWNPQQYIGRGEEFYTYNNFTRAINFSFKAASFNKESLLAMYNKLNLLAGATAPSYSEGGSFMRGTLSRITIGDLLYRQTGFISSLGLSWNNSYQWEISDREGENMEKLPHVLDVSVQFTPIHTFNVKSDLNLKDEKYFGKRTKRPPDKQLKKNNITENTGNDISNNVNTDRVTQTFKKQRNRVEQTAKNEIIKVDVTPIVSNNVNINNLLNAPVPIDPTDTSNPTTINIGTNDRRATDFLNQRNLGQTGIYLDNN